MIASARRDDMIRSKLQRPILPHPPANAAALEVDRETRCLGIGLPIKVQKLRLDRIEAESPVDRFRKKALPIVVGDRAETPAFVGECRERGDGEGDKANAADPRRPRVRPGRTGPRVPERKPIIDPDGRGQSDDE